MMQISSTMAPKGRNVVIRAFNRRLRDENLDGDFSKGSNEELNVRVDFQANVPQTKAQTALVSIEVESIS